MQETHNEAYNAGYVAGWRNTANVEFLAGMFIGALLGIGGMLALMAIHHV